MQGYYNMPYMAAGGALFSLAGSTAKYLEKLIGSEKGIKSLKGLILNLGKKNPTLAEGIKNLLDKKLDAKGIEDLQKLAKQHLVTTSRYQSRLKNIQNALRYRKQALDILKKTEKPGSKVVETASAQGAVENPIPGTTLSGRWKQFKNWMNNHPKTTIGIPLFAASGTGRDILGGIGSVYMAHPFSSDSEDEKQKSVVTIDGVDIPITMGDNGKFVVDTTGGKKPKKTTEDDIDSLIDAAAATSTVPNTPVSNTPSQDVLVSDQSQQMINDLFSDDQWDS